MHDVALRAQVLQGYEEFKVRICALSPLVHTRQRRPFNDPDSYSLPMDRSRQSLGRWDSRLWNYSSRGSSLCGHGSGGFRRIQNLATASVRPSTTP